MAYNQTNIKPEEARPQKGYCQSRKETKERETEERGVHHYMTVNQMDILAAIITHDVMHMETDIQEWKNTYLQIRKKLGEMNEEGKNDRE